MSAVNLQDLAQQFCTFIGLAVPGLEPDGDGIFSFSAKVREVDITLTHDPLRHPQHCFVLVFFGPASPEQELPILRELLNVNLLMLAPGAPSFSRNPLTGDVVLQYIYPLADASGRGLWEGLQAVVDSVLKWRVDFFLDHAALLAPRDVAAGAHGFA